MSGKKNKNTVLKIDNGIVYFAVIYKKQEFVAQVSSEDWDRVSKHSWSLAFSKKENSFKNLKTNLGNNKFISLHRFVMQPNDGRVWVDHVNGNIFDNTRKNLRLANPSINAKNVKNDRKNNKTGHKGVVWHKATKKWGAQIQSDGKHVWLGTFKTKEEAVAAYKSAEKRLFGEFARINHA